MLYMDEQDLKTKAHEADVTVWVGKAGPEAVTDELAEQLAQRDLVKVKFLRSARGEHSVPELAERLATATDSELLDTRGHTAVLYR